MLFNSTEFIFFFLPFVFLSYYALLNYTNSGQNRLWLLLCSLFFYAWWNPAFLALILISMTVNYGTGRLLQEPRSHKQLAILWCGITFNLGLLFYYKYIDFVIENLNRLPGFELPLANTILPLAISFFTFQQIAYIVDCYRREARETNFINYGIFVSFFPQLIAGPIVHHQQIMPQFASDTHRNIDVDKVFSGFFLFCIGLFKKTVLADPLTVWVDKGFTGTGELSFIWAWCASVGYTFQLYFDYSGYADMAVGLARMFSIRLPINFNSPLKALSIADFWTRWNITLIDFLRRYVYIPLGGNRHGMLKQDRNLFITFMLSGVWHGAGWTFLLWGVLHGIVNVMHLHWKNSRFRLNAFWGWFLTFNFINVICIIFKADSISEVIRFLWAMININSLLEALTAAFYQQQYLFVEQNVDITFAFQLIICAGVVFLPFPNSNVLVERCRLKPAYLFATGALFVCAYLGISNNSQEFIYYAF